MARVYGFKTTVVPVHVTTNNYARDTMLIYATSDTDNDYPDPFTPAPGDDPELEDGKSTPESTFKDSYFWQTALGFAPTLWDLGKVWGLGYPTLRNVAGQ